MRTMGAGEFKAKCLAVLDEVKETGEPVLITKRGKPVARLTALAGRAARRVDVDSIFRSLGGMIEVAGDPKSLLEPIIPREEWEHLKRGWTPFRSE